VEKVFTQQALQSGAFVLLKPPATVCLDYMLNS